MKTDSRREPAPAVCDSVAAMSAALDRARVYLLTSHPFFGSIVLRREVLTDPSVGTMAVDGSGQIHANPAFVTALTPAECVFMLAHEAMHVVLAHLARRRWRQALRWNIAADLVINDLLVKEGVGSMPTGGCYVPDASSSPAEVIYETLPPDDDTVLLLSDLPAGQASRAGPDEAVSLGQAEIAQACRVAVATGGLSDTLTAFSGRVLASKPDWQVLLERFFIARTREHRQYTWAQPDKRYLPQGLYLPKRAPVPSVGVLCVVIDESASVTDDVLSAFLGHVLAVCEHCRPTTIHLLYTTDRVTHLDTFERSAEVMVRDGVRDWGRTDLRAAFDAMASQGLRPDTVVVFTDGLTPLPASVPCPTLWALTGMPCVRTRALLKSLGEVLDLRGLGQQAAFAGHRLAQSLRGPADEGDDPETRKKEQ